MEQPEQTNMEFEDQIEGAMLIAKEWLGLLSRIVLTDEERVAKTVEVALKLSAQILVLALRHLDQDDHTIAGDLKEIKLRADYTVDHDAIFRYALAEQLPKPETVAKLYTKYVKDSKSAFKRAEKRKTVKLVAAKEYRERMVGSIITNT